ncbi:MAG TPA: hypothetical protein VM049_02565 [Gaiellaceae bacterium]|nr:hypothetical protein [Gaiellaceae bacterium]
MKLLAAAVAAAALGLPAAQGSSPATVPGLVYTPGYGNSILTSYDPVTLVRSGPRVRLGGNASSWSWSPARRYLAIASYPQRLTIVDARNMRVVTRMRLARGGGVARAVTWAGSRVLAVVEAPAGTVVTVVDPFTARVIRTTRVAHPFGYQLERLRDGLVFLLGARNRSGPARVAVVDALGETRVAVVPQARVGTVGLAVDPVRRKAYLAEGEAVFALDLRTLAVSDRGPLRALAKAPLGSERSARWLGNGRLAVSGLDRDQSNAEPAGLRIIDLRDGTSRTIDPTASSFTRAGSVLVVEHAQGREGLSATAYGFGGRQRYHLDLVGSTWMKKQGRLGYACRQAFLRAVVDLETGGILRARFAAGTRCPTLLVDDSRS